MFGAFRSRRIALQRIGFSFGLISGLVATSLAQAQPKPIVIGMPIPQSGPVLVADGKDWQNGAEMAVKEINAKGGVKGRMIQLKVVDIDVLTPEGTQAAFRKLVDAKVNAIASPSVIIPTPAMEAVANYKAPYLHGNTQISSLDLVRKNPKRYNHIFQVDPPETFYGTNFPNFLNELKASGGWKPTNNKVHLITEQLAYAQTITKNAEEAIKKDGKFEVVKVTQIQFPVQDWGPILQEIKKTGAGVVMLNHWAGAEEAAFAKQFAANPLPGALVYIQYGPSQPEFLNLAGAAAEGFVWSTMYGVYADKQGQAFRDKYKVSHVPKGGNMGLAYSGGGYDTVQLLAKVWNKVDADKFDAVTAELRKTTYRGVNGFYRFDNANQASLHYPLETKNLEEGMAQLYFQVQGGEHKIISPTALQQGAFKLAPWMK